MALPAPAPGPVSGRVESVNERGVKIDGDWFNVSKWASDVVLPERGDVVTLSLDARGFIRSVAIGEAGSTASYAARVPHSASSAQRDTTITRLAVLKAAAEFSASKASSTSADVLKIAACWERWVLRDDSPVVDELDEAF